jgi:hypothetical protein
LGEHENTLKIELFAGSDHLGFADASEYEPGIMNLLTFDFKTNMRRPNTSHQVKT